MASVFLESKREQFLERPLPSSEEGERIILGAVLLDNALIAQVIEQLKTDDFYSPRHRRIFEAMTALFEAARVIDPILIGEELKKEGLLESIGGIATITNLTYGLPHFSDLRDYIKVVKDKSILRNLIRVCNEVTSEALSEEDDAENILDHAERRIFALADEKTRQGFSAIAPIAEEVIRKVEEYAKRETHALTGLATGFRELDEKTSGLQRNDLIIVAARPSMGKCLEAKSLITLSDGSVKTIEEIYADRRAKLLTLQDDFKFSLVDASDFIDDGIKPTYQLNTKLGRRIETTITHPYLTISGWKKLEEIEFGEKIAVPRILGVFGQSEIRECEVKLLGYLLGDGCLTKNSPEFTVGKEWLREDFISAVNQFGEIEAVQCNTPNRTFSLRVRKTGGKRRGDNPLTIWLRERGIFGCNSHSKFIPNEVFTLKKELIALFLNRLFATDGWLSILTSGQVQLGFASVSEQMIRQIAHLLLRFGVITNLKERKVKYENTRRTAWQIDITDAKSIRTFASEIGIFGKERNFERALTILDAKNYQTNKDLIPVEIWEHLSAVKGAESWSSLAKRAEIKGHTNIHVGKRAPTRARLATLASCLEDKYLHNLAESEVYWDEVVSIEYVGEKQVYDLTIPETHNFVANDICVHNTALCLTMAQNAAIQEKAVVAIFSLEMSKEQLVMRMLSSESKVDAHRFRTGYLTRDEWGRLAEGIQSLSDTRIFIDDSPGISVLQMRAKARRLKAEQKALDLIIVDYLQLMSGSKRTESRQQEVSQISRELKSLAKELNVPVVALSQLSRAPEARNPPRPMMSDLRESGCLTGESLVTLAETGERVPIRDLVGRKGFYVWALNKNTWRIEKGLVINAFATGVKPVYKLTTRLGRQIRATANHKFLDIDGWKRLDELSTGQRIALPREIRNVSIQTLSDDELALLGHLIGDGCTLPRHAIQYTTAEEDIAENVKKLATAVFGEEVAPRINPERNWFQVYLSSTRHHTHGVRSALAEWLEELGIWGLRSYEKFVPAKIFQQPNSAIALFLRHLWATDGCIHPPRGNHAPGVYYASSSERLARDVQILLLRLGINAILSRWSQNGKGRDQFHVGVSGKHDLEKFARIVGATGRRKADSLAQIVDYLSSKLSNTNRDVLSRDIWSRFVFPVMKEKGISHRRLAELINMSYCGSTLYKSNVSRGRALRVADAVDIPELRQLSQSDIYWDEIISIELEGNEEVFDLTVQDYSNFEADGFIVHNSIEQDADVVAFIYREDYYKPDDENAGVAEIILAKQRNGPIGTVKLAFLKEFTRFENYFGD